MSLVHVIIYVFFSFCPQGSDAAECMIWSLLLYVALLCTSILIMLVNWGSFGTAPSNELDAMTLCYDDEDNEFEALVE